MSDFRRVTDDFWVSPQISVADVATAKAEGFTAIINNRPDGKSPDQPPSAAIAAAARAAGLDYLHAPVTGRPSPQTVVEVDAASRGRKTLAFCRSGTRSIVTWALGRAHDLPSEDIVRLGAAAGYDLTGVV